jgi:hypothetical protein
VSVERRVPTARNTTFDQSDLVAILLHVKENSSFKRFHVDTHTALKHSRQCAWGHCMASHKGCGRGEIDTTTATFSGIIAPRSFRVGISAALVFCGASLSAGLAYANCVTADASTTYDANPPNP